MAHTFLSEHEISFVSRSNRILIEKRKEEQRFQKQFSAFLLKGGMPEHVARSVLNGGVLFPDEDLQAQKILKQTILAFFSKNKDFFGYEEPIRLEGIIFMYQLIDKKIPIELQPVIKMIIQKRTAIEQQKYDQITAKNQPLIQKYKRQIEERNNQIRFNFPFAVLGLCSVLAGIITLFVGFHKWTYPEMFSGLFLLAPALVIQDSPNSFIRLRKDTQKAKEIENYHQEIEQKQRQIDEQSVKIINLEKQLQNLFTD